MFLKIHLFSQEAPDGDGDFRWAPHPYLRMDGTVPRGPATFSWNERQLQDISELWLDSSSEGARDRLAGDLAAFIEKLGWNLDPEQLEAAEERGEEVLLTVSSAARELYVLPWEVIKAGPSDIYLADFSNVLVRYAVPGLEARDEHEAPPSPGILFAWSAAGGPVPHREQGESIRAAAEVGGVEVREVADVDEGSLQAALEDGDGAPSVLHLLCHGLPGAEGEPPCLRWGSTSSPRSVTATRLARLLRRYKSAIRLVVLSACGSGDGQNDALFMSSLAQELHRKGIACVVASRYLLSVSGSQILVENLYDRLLREAWSLERALPYARAALFKPDAGGESHPGDAYGLQLYAHQDERVGTDNQVTATRPVLATYPFGTSAQPVPASNPPRKSATVEVEVSADEAEAAGSTLKEKLAGLAEDGSLKYKVKKASKAGLALLLIDTTVDGGQRLLEAWGSGQLSQGIGWEVSGMSVSRSLMPPQGAPGGAEQAGNTTTAGNSATAGKSSTAASSSSKAAASAGKAAASAGKAAAAGVGKAAAVGVGKVAVAKLAIAAAVAVAAGTAAVATGVVGPWSDDEPQHEPDQAMLAPVDRVPADPPSDPRSDPTTDPAPTDPAPTDPVAATPDASVPKSDKSAATRAETGVNGRATAIEAPTPTASGEASLTPNILGGGDLPSGYEKITFGMWDGNWARNITLPASPADGAVVTIDSKATWSATLDTTKVDIPLDTLGIHTGDSYQFTYRSRSGTWEIQGASVAYYSPNKDGAAIPDTHPRLSIYTMADGNWTAAVTLPGTGKNDDMVVIRSRAGYNAKIEGTHQQYQSSTFLRRGDDYSFVYRANVQRWELLASPQRVLTAKQAKGKMGPPTSPRTLVVFSDDNYLSELVLPLSPGDRDQVTLKSTATSEVLIDGRNIDGLDVLPLKKGDTFSFTYLADKATWVRSQ